MYFITALIVMCLSVPLGYILALIRHDEHKHIGELYIFDLDVDTDFGPSMLVQLEASIEDLDLHNGDIVTIRVADRRRKTRK